MLEKTKSKTRSETGGHASLDGLVFRGGKGINTSLMEKLGKRGGPRREGGVCGVNHIEISIRSWRLENVEGFPRRAFNLEKLKEGKWVLWNEGDHGKYGFRTVQPGLQMVRNAPCHVKKRGKGT